MKSSAEIRQKFISFFEKNGHKLVPSSSLVPDSDPSVLLNTAGMQQFKPFYLDSAGVLSKFASCRLVSIQKCFRTTDIDSVGDDFHLTFLEMLGNFSFGYPRRRTSYWKREAIGFAWDFLTKEMQIDPTRLWVSFFKGDQAMPKDKEVVSAWLDIGIPPERIIGFGREHNFWGPTGESGPCGPTTEIHYKIRDYKTKEKDLPNYSENFVEVWNLVFNELFFEEGKFSPLKEKGVDTGMGLERLAMISQHSLSVFDTDLFRSVREELEHSLNNNKESSPALKKTSARGVQEKSIKIIADHIRSICFLVGDGVYPSNVTRGYVLRRIIRRTLRYLKLLGLGQDILPLLVEAVIRDYSSFYPALASHREKIKEVVSKESLNFNRSLVKGVRAFNRIVAALPSEIQVFPADKAFLLFSSFGLPFDFIKDMCLERGLFLNEKEFKKIFKKHQKVSRGKAL